MERGGGKWEFFYQDSMLIGHYTHEIDTKKRLTLPSKWRKGLGEKVIVTSGLDKSLFVFSLNEWETIAKKLSSLSFGSSESRNLTRFFLSNAFEVDIDAQGRVVIPEVLKAHAGLQESIVLVGMYTRIELWDEKEWNVCFERSRNQADSVAELLSKQGVI